LGLNPTPLWYNEDMADKKKKPPKKNMEPDGRGSRPRDPSQLALWVVQQSTSPAAHYCDVPHDQKGKCGK